MTEVVGLYMNPPDNAIVLCVDEKSQIQALDRTQPGLPMKKGRAGTMTHDYKRNGTTSLFAAFETMQGRVVGQCFQRHRNQEFIRFLRTLDHEFPGDVPPHLILDNYATHKHAKRKGVAEASSALRPAFHPHQLQLLNLVERWLRELTDKAVRRGVFASVPDLKAAIDAFLSAWNDDPKPFVWTATVESIMEKVSKCRQTLEAIAPGSTRH